MSLCLRIAPVFAVCVLLFTTSGFSQINDNFSDGDFVADPVWSGTTENYIVNTDLELQLNDDEAGFSYLSSGGTTQSIDDREWRFKLELDFSPSGNNNCRFYLASVTGDLTYAGESACGASGYFLQFGESGSDDAIRLFRDDDVGDSPVELGAGTLGLLASSFEVGVKVGVDTI